MLEDALRMEPALQTRDTTKIQRRYDARPQSRRGEPRQSRFQKLQIVFQTLSLFQSVECGVFLWIAHVDIISSLTEEEAPVVPVTCRNFVKFFRAIAEASKLSIVLQLQFRDGLLKI